MELAHVVKRNLNIAVETEVLSYAYTGSLPREVIARVDLGSNDQPIIGNGNYYSLRFYVNDVRVIPAADVPVPSGAVAAILASRPVPIAEGDLISIRVVGQAGDVAITTICSLRDVTGLLASDVFGGGPVRVDHNFGGPDNLAYQTASGAAIDGATILVFTQADYDAGHIAAGYAVARALTLADRGEWNRPVMLAPGAYTVLFTKPGAFGPDTRAITVPE